MCSCGGIQKPSRSSKSLTVDLCTSGCSQNCSRSGAVTLPCRSRAVLASSVEQASDGEWAVQLLVEYSLGDRVEFEQFTATGGNEDVPLTATQIHAVWLSAAELRIQSGVLLRYYLGDEVVCTAVYNRTYEAPSVRAKPADEPKTKSTKKDGNSGRAVSPRPVSPRNISPRNISPRNAGASVVGTGPLVPPGQQPPTFATVQPIVALSDRSVANAVIPDKSQPAEYWGAVASVVDEEYRTQRRSLFLFALSDVTLPFATEDADAAAAPKFELDLRLQVQINRARVERRARPSSCQSKRRVSLHALVLLLCCVATAAS